MITNIAYLRVLISLSRFFLPLQGIINVDFDFFNPHEGDYHATKNLLNQLFQNDAQLLAVEGLTELLIGQTQIGTTVKTDGLDADPYAFVTVVNLDVHRASCSLLHVTLC